MERGQTGQAVDGANFSGRLGFYPSLRQFSNFCKTHVISKAEVFHIAETLGSF